MPPFAEARPAAPERVAAQVAAAAPSLSAAPAASAQDDDEDTAGTQADPKKTSKSVVPKAIKDEDLIEKEWVERAKSIVEKTKDDPYKQSEELTLVKADYLKQHYDKEIKVSK